MPWQQASQGTCIGFGNIGVQGMRKLSVSHHAKQLCEATKSVSADELSHKYLQLFNFPKYKFCVKHTLSRM